MNKNREKMENEISSSVKSTPYVVPENFRKIPKVTLRTDPKRGVSKLDCPITLGMEVDDKGGKILEDEVRVGSQKATNNKDGSVVVTAIESSDGSMMVFSEEMPSYICVGAHAYKSNSKTGGTKRYLIC